MSYLVIASTTISVATANATGAYVEVGDRKRADDGTLHSTIRGRKREWDVRTTPLTLAAAASLVTTLTGTPPLSCSGDALGGSVSCHVQMVGWEDMKLSGAVYRALRFKLMEQ